MYIYVGNGRVSGKKFVFAVFSGTGGKKQSGGTVPPPCCIWASQRPFNIIDVWEKVICKKIIVFVMFFGYEGMK
jgi:hypothetical protein